MLTIEQIKEFNELELGIYNYILHHREAVLQMKIRELADAVHVSTSTILRFCKKTGCNGFAEFKARYQYELAQQRSIRIDHEIPLMLEYFHKINDASFFAQIDATAMRLSQCDKVIFTGIGTSGSLAQYGARTFNNYGTLSFCIEDPFYPIRKGDFTQSAIIALSVSGETIETLRHVNEFQKQGAYIIAITNQKDCTLARLANQKFLYYMPFQCIEETFNVTTQVPVVFLIETLAKRVKELDGRKSAENATIAKEENR